MNGTSVDGVDLVLTEIHRRGKGADVKFKAHERVEFPHSLKSQLMRAVQRELRVEELSLLHHQLGCFYADSLLNIKKRKKWKFDLIGVHGQTVFHHVQPGHSQHQAHHDRLQTVTYQIAEPAYLTEMLQIPVVSNFRPSDLVVGGQGAPIASLFHQVAFARSFKNKAFAVHNLGGISNLTFIAKNGKVQRAFDTGPANMLLDLGAHYFSRGAMGYDHDGQMAKAGIPSHQLVENMLGDTFFSKAPPKSCGREQFGEKFFESFLAMSDELSPEDRMATLTELTAKSIAINYLLFCKPTPTAIVVCGGGAHNSHLLSRIKFHMPTVKVMTTKDFGWPPEAIEGGAFALLAAYRVWELPNNIPQTTGARRPVCMGQLTIP